MSAIKRWCEDHIPQMTDEELADYGCSPEEIEFLRECFPSEE